MKLSIFQVDAFTNRIFAGNPAAVCPLEGWLDDTQMQAIAAENNLSETAFLTPEGSEYALRWFTPTVEVNLCGHATLAAAYVVLNRLDPQRDGVTFSSRSGPLRVTRTTMQRFQLDFPSQPATLSSLSLPLIKALGSTPQEFWMAAQANNGMAVFGSEAIVQHLTPDMALLGGLGYGLIVTAPGSDCAFVSRYFAPQYGIPEDPVTGSAHCTLMPYWANRLSQNELFARQISQRGGEIWCQQQGDRVLIEGQAVLYMEGCLWI